MFYSQWSQRSSRICVSFSEEGTGAVFWIERLDSVAARFFPRSRSRRILARFLYTALYLLPDLYTVSMGAIFFGAKKA